MLLNFFAERFGSGIFENEKLWLGHTGHFFIVFSFFSALLAFLSYFAAEFSTNENDKKSWNRIGRISFIAHGSAILGVFILLFVMILNHMFEYHYAWRHSSTTLPLKYIISSFWEGQEGSFLLWMFWISVLGVVGIFRFKSYENPVMGVIAITEVFLASMVLGIYVFGYKVGSNPFVLLRDEMNTAPIFQRANYLQLIKDGNGLNPLLQNYWMTIHPPVLFLGFASVTVPFAFVIGSLLRRDWDGWVKPALPWTLFSIAVLGTGILMGGAWAYESLSFGGFWAWDPVENMSFVPWLMLVAGLHTLLVYRYTKQSLIITYVFLILSFSFVLYSTFLTRSGILGDTSVHAFTDLGMTGQLLVYMTFFMVVGLGLLIIRVVKKQIPSQQKEEDTWSREFWMFIGALVLLLSAVQMTFTTSIPVWNKLFDLNLAPPEDVVHHYNAIQIWLAILVAALTALVQFFSYRSGRIPSTAKWAAFSFLASLVLAIVLAWGLSIHFTQQHLIDLTKLSDKLFIKFPFLSTHFMFLLASVYAVLANLAYLFIVLKGNFKLSGGSITHFGFGIFLIGVIISQGKKEVISINNSGIDFGKEFKQNEKVENILLLKDSAMQMGDYLVTYKGSEQREPDNFFIVEYIRKDKTGNEAEKFTLRPNAQINPNMGLIANPDTKHYLTKDVFTHVTSIPDNTNLKDSLMIAEMTAGDTFFTRNAYLIFEALNPKPELPEDFETDGKLVVGIQLLAKTLEGETYKAAPVFVIDMAAGNAISSISAEVKELNVVVDVRKIDPQSKKVTLEIHEKEKPSDFIIMKAIIFPYINLVWFGGILTFLGALLSMWRRVGENRKEKN
ncbi:MAG: cytochrome c biogenesis protein CcsA [Chitinophagales bacterium]|nr:cytochrome c biogenesis protein CcsA [Chitinophagales bacterium]